jgi:hypothetical protein
MDQPPQPEPSSPTPPHQPPMQPPPPPPRNPNVITPEQAQNPILVLVIAILLGPVAYFVIGQWQKGLAGVFIMLWALIIMIITCLLGFVIYFPLAVVLAIDVYMQASLLQRGHSIGHWTFFGYHL